MRCQSWTFQASTQKIQSRAHKWRRTSSQVCAAHKQPVLFLRPADLAHHRELSFNPFFTPRPAFKDIGFVTIVGHGVPEELKQRTFAASASFFTGLTPELKAKYRFTSAESNRGYLMMGQERLDGDYPDLKEMFQIGDENEKTFENHWPNAELPAFRKTMLEYFFTMDKLHLDVLRCLAIGMNLPEEYFTPLCNGNHQMMRLLHYPECPRAQISSGGQKRGGVHSDYGSITLLNQWQDQGGLEACRRDGEWVFVPPVVTTAGTQTHDQIWVCTAAYASQLVPNMAGGWNRGQHRRLHDAVVERCARLHTLSSGWHTLNSHYLVCSHRVCRMRRPVSRLGY